MIGKEVSHYRILEKIGGGGMGVVYKAEDTRLGRPVALKFLNPGLIANESTRKRFLHEARAASVIDHPNVCHIYEVSETDDGRLFLAMSYCEGRSLREVIDSGPVPAREAFGIAFGVAQGLWAAHRRGIIHRDVKPGNIILTDDGFVRIVDFGLALLIGHSRVTTSGVTVGTVAYMSPEQSTGASVGANTDIWSLGVTLYEMVTGRLPFRGEINPAMVYSIVHEPHTPVTELNSSVPAGCARVIDRCLEKDPATRYQTVEDLLEDMVLVARELGWESSVASTTIAPILRARRWQRWKKRVLVTGAAVVVLAGAGWGLDRWVNRTPSLYTTEIRLAVMPLDNLIGAENDAFVDGLSDHVTRVARWVSRDHRSMWTVLYTAVIDANLPGPEAAGPAFGVNRVITGNVQRSGKQHELRLKLLDATTSDVIKEAAIGFDIDSPTALVDSILPAICRWTGPGEFTRSRTIPWKTADARSIRPYFEGLSYYRRSGKERDLLDRAASALEECVAFDSSFASAACVAGSVGLESYRRHGDRARLDRALREGRAARARAPAFTDAGVLLGLVFRTLNEPDSAEACFLQAIAADPANVTAYTRLADLYASQKRMQEAEDTYRRAINAHSDYWVAHRILGVFFYNQHRLDDAAREWQFAVELAPRDVDTLNNLGAVHHFRGEWTRARERFLESFRINPNCYSCNNVALTLFFDGKFNEAAEYFELALTPQYCDSTEHIAWGNWASALYWVEDERPKALKLYRRAIVLGEQALAANPDSPDVIARLVDYYAMNGDSVRAHAMIARAAPYLEKDDNVMYRVGSAYEKLGDRELALHHLGNAARHGYPLPAILGDPVLRDLVTDPRFQESVHNEAAADGAGAARTKQ